MGSLEGIVKDGEDVKTASFEELMEVTAYVSTSEIKSMVETYKLPSGDLVEGHRFYDYHDGKQEVNCYEGKAVEWKTLKEIDHLKMIETQRYAVKAAFGLASKVSPNV